MTKIANNSICPVCGNRVELIRIESSPESGPGWGWASYQVVCENCGAEGPYTTDIHGPNYVEKEQEYAINGWNKLIGAAR